MRKILITNAEYGQTLSIIRSLSSHNIEIITAGWNKFAASYYSRYVKKSYRYKHPQEDQEQFISDIIKIIKKEKPDVLLPVGVATFLTISKYKKRLEKLVNLPVADYSSIIQAHNKNKVIQLAKKVGVPFPKTFVLNKDQSIEEILEKTGLPVIVKARLGSGIFARANSLKEVKEKVKEIEKEQSSEGVIECHNPVIQEFIFGKIHDCCVLFNKGKLRAALTQERVRTCPISGGPGIINETTIEPKLIEFSKKLLRPINYHGPAQLEFIIDEKTNEPKLIEINTKLWGTSALSIKAGINFSLLAFKLAINKDIDPVMEYREGIKYKWLLPNGLRYLKQSKQKVKDCFELLNCFNKKTYCNLSCKDPIPDFFQIGRMFAEQILPRNLIEKLKKK